jgi:hypothetical protein
MTALIESVATIAAVFGVVKTTKWYINYENEKAIKAKEKAVNLYVETGTKDQAFYYLDRSTVKAAERKRVRLIKKRCKETKNFTSFCECPQCNAFDLHNIVHIRFGYCFRECTTCKYTWRQK